MFGRVRRCKGALLRINNKAFDDNKSLSQKVKASTVKLLKSVNWMRTLGFSFKKVIYLQLQLPYWGPFFIVYLANEFSKADAKGIRVKKLTVRF